MKTISHVKIRFTIKNDSGGSYMIVGDGITIKATVENAIATHKNLEEIEALKLMRLELK